MFTLQGPFCCAKLRNSRCVPYLAAWTCCNSLIGSTMPAAKTLIDEIGGLPETRNDHYPWLKTLDEGTRQQVLAVAKDWLAGGVVRRKIPSRRGLWRYLTGRDPRKPVEAIPNTISVNQFVRFLDRLEEGRSGS